MHHNGKGCHRAICTIMVRVVTGLYAILYNGKKLGVCGKQKFASDIKKSEPSKKFDICADGFPTETVCNLQFKLKVTKITLLAFTTETEFIIQYAQFIQHSTVWYGIVGFNVPIDTL